MINALKHKYLNRTYVLILFLLCGLSATAVNGQTPSETPPPPGEPRPVTVPEVREMVLDNGLRVVVVQKRNLPLVSISLLVKSGSDAESPDKAGLADMTADLLIKGTEFRTATEIAEQIDFLGGSMATLAGWNNTNVFLNIMSDKMGRALSIMSDSVIRPSFPEKEIALTKKQTLDNLRVNLKQPGTLLAYVASTFSYGEHPGIGTEATIKRIKRRDLQEFHSKNYRPENSVLIFTGDISPDRAFRFAKLFFGGWEKTPVRTIIGDRSVRPNAEMSSDDDRVIKRMLVVDLPDSGQAAVGYAKRLDSGRIFCEADLDQNIDCNNSPIYYPASVLNSVLGGSYSARLNQEIRLKRGLSYGARSGFAWREFDSNFNANTQTKNESAGEVAELIRLEIEKLAESSVKEEEMVPRKAVVIGGFSRGLQSNDDLGARLRELYLYDLSAEELNTFIPSVRDVSEEDVKRFAAEHLLGGDMIIVGDAKIFLDDLKRRFPDHRIEVIRASDLDLNKPNLGLLRRVAVR